MKFDFSGEVAVITGAAGNLGEAVARAFHAAGAKLALIDVAPDRFKGLFPDFAQSPDCFFVSKKVDVTNPNEVSPVVDEINQRFGRIDVLVNLVGGYRAGAPLHETPPEDLDFMLSMNARSVFVMSRAVIPLMLSRKKGRIVNIGSRAAQTGNAGHAAYSAAKAAVIRLTESMDEELKDRGINVNCVLPAIIDTAPNRAAMPGADFGKWVAPRDVASVILFLACEGARAIHGAAIPVYGQC